MLLTRTLLGIAGAVLIAGPAAALSITLDMAGSEMVMVNQVCAPCSVAVDGTITLEDDEAGNVTITGMNLSHAPYEVGNPIFVSVILERTDITLGAGPELGAGSTLGSNVLFGTTDLAQAGTTTCTPAAVGCLFAGGLPVGVSPLPGSVLGIDLGTWVFDGLHNLTSASLLYTDDAQATETLNLTGVVVPEPGTFLLMASGLAMLGIRGRTRR